MGSTYASVTVVGTTGGEVIAAMGDEPAFVADAGDGNVVVFAEADELDGFSAGCTARRLSEALERPVLEVSVFDEDLLQYQVCIQGRPITEGVSPVAIVEAMGEVGVPEPDPVAPVAALGRGDADGCEPPSTATWSSPRIATPGSRQLSARRRGQPPRGSATWITATTTSL